MRQMRRPKRNPRLFLLLVAHSILLPRVGAAPVSIPHGTVDLIAENQSIAPGDQCYLGLHFQLEKGWHIYWMNPGDSGQPPRAEWHLPAGLTIGEMEWPAPRRLGTAPIVDFGYDDAVTLLVPLRASARLPANQSAQLGAELKLLVCREICIPGKAQMSMSLRVKPIPAEPEARTRELFASARKSLPRPLPADWKIGVSDEKDSFVLAAKVGRQITQATFFPLYESQIDNSAPQKLTPVASGFELTLQKSDQLLKPIKRLKGVLELSHQSYMIEAPVGNPKASLEKDGLGRAAR
jgi:DsbC/DsbD-like thiol-disulfide interchange protein